MIEKLDIEREPQRQIAGFSLWVHRRQFPDLHDDWLDCDNLGHIEMTVSMTPDHMTQRHEFIFATDQTILTPSIAAIVKILEHVPVRGTP